MNFDLTMPSASSQRQSQNERISQNMNLNGSIGASWNPPASSCGAGPIGEGNSTNGCAGVGVCFGDTTIRGLKGYGNQDGNWGIGARHNFRY